MFVCYCAHLNIVWCTCEGGGMLYGICIVSAYVRDIYVSFPLPPPSPPVFSSLGKSFLEGSGRDQTVLLSFLSPPPPASTPGLFMFTAKMFIFASRPV
jgi:hypothetical protein